MARYLKQSTAQTLRIGPFVDDTDGVTAETGLSIGQADIQISKDGGAFAQTSDASPTTTHDTDGWYQCPLTATDTDTLGSLTVQVAMSGALPVWEHFMVLPANVFDSLVDGSDALEVDTIQVGGTVQTANDVGGDVDSILAWPAAWDAEVQSEVTDALNAYDPPTNAEMEARTLVAADYFDPSADTVDVGSISGSSTAADTLEEQMDALEEGTAQAGAAGSITLRSGASASDDFFNGGVVWITGGTGAGQFRVIDDYVGSTKVASVSPDWVVNPDATSVYVISGAPSSADSPPDVNVTQVGGTTQTSNDMSGDVDTVLSRIIGTLATGTHNPQSGDAYARLGAPAGASVSADIAALPLDTEIMPESNATFTYQFNLIDASGDPATGVTVTANRIIDGGAVAAATGTVTEISNGVYEFAASAADMNGGRISHIFSGTGAKTAFAHFITTAGV